MSLKIDSLTIERFRAIRELKIESLGRVNLITGRNNSGKSSVLEAIRLLASDASPSAIFDILQSREENVTDADASEIPIDPEDILVLSSLFQGFPQHFSKFVPIRIASSGAPRPMQLSIAAGWLSVQPDVNGVNRYVLQPENILDDGQTLPGLIITSGDVQRLYSLTSLQRDLSRPFSRLELIDPSRAPCILVGPYGGESTAALGPLWDKIALSDLEPYIVEALRIIDPKISAISMVGGNGSRRERTAIVRAAGLPRPVPLRSFGDGVNRIFGIILSLVNAKGGLLLIDEFENGIHHTVQTDAWRIVFKLARRLDIQVVATSHSWDAIEAFQKAASEDLEAGVLIRLSRMGEDIIPTLFSENELAIVTRDHIEVR
ncbi:MAG: AAA family ATPase [Armatimonadota bacterium]|nr:AAA family ATPase [Armatimonadota bacterium]